MHASSRCCNSRSGANGAKRLKGNTNRFGKQNASNYCEPFVKVDVLCRLTATGTTKQASKLKALGSADMNPQQSFAGSKSMSTNYQGGVPSYYEQHGDSYRNPHFPGIVSAVFTIMGSWVQDVLVQTYGTDVVGTLNQAATATAYKHVATPICMPISSQAVNAMAPEPAQPPSGDNTNLTEPDPAYVTDQPAQFSSDSTDPAPSGQGSTTEPRRCILIPAPCSQSSYGYGPGPVLRVLDLACGSGEATQALGAWWHAIGRMHLSDIKTTLRTDVPGTTVNLQPSDASDGQQQCCDLSAQDPCNPSAGTHNTATVACTDRAVDNDLFVGDLPDVGGLQLCVDAADPYTGLSFQAWTGRLAEKLSFQVGGLMGQSQVMKAMVHMERGWRGMSMSMYTHGNGDGLHSILPTHS